MKDDDVHTTTLARLKERLEIYHKKYMIRFKTTKWLCVGADAPTLTPTDSRSESAFTLLTPNWISVTNAVELVAGEHIYAGPAVDSGLVVYTVPPNRLAMLLSCRYSDIRTNVRSAIRDTLGRLYFISTISFVSRLERFPLLDENDQFVVWADEETDRRNHSVGVSFIEFDKTLSCGRFYQIIRFSSTKDASAEYQIPDEHSAILVPNLLPIGNDGIMAAESILLGTYNSEATGLLISIENVIDSTIFSESTEGDVEVRDPFRVSDYDPITTILKGGDTLRISLATTTSTAALMTGYAVLLVKRH